MRASRSLLIGFARLFRGLGRHAATLQPRAAAALGRFAGAAPGRANARWLLGPGSAGLLLAAGLGACTLITDVDRERIPQPQAPTFPEIDAGPQPTDPALDASVPDASLDPDGGDGGGDAGALDAGGDAGDAAADADAG